MFSKILNLENWFKSTPTNLSKCDYFFLNFKSWKFIQVVTNQSIQVQAEFLKIVNKLRNAVILNSYGGQAEYFYFKKTRGRCDFVFLLGAGWIFENCKLESAARKYLNLVNLTFWKKSKKAILRRSMRNWDLVFFRYSWARRGFGF